jgi:FkbM family methyltransferase
MTTRVISNGAGMEIMAQDFRAPGRLALAVLFRMPPRLREAILFGSSRICVPLQKGMVRLLGGAHLVETRFTDGPMRGLSFRCWTSEKYFSLGSHYENEAQNLLADLLKPGDVVYDIGGHAGYMALLFSAMVGPTGRVFSFEPSPLNYTRLERNVNANRRSNLTVVKAAASDREGEAFIEERGTVSAILENGREASAPLSRIRTIRLDDFAYGSGNPTPTFVKVDVEGYAGPVLEGMRRILENAQPGILCEIHNPHEEARISRVLTNYQYRLLPIGSQKRYPRRAIALPADGDLRARTVS